MKILFFYLICILSIIADLNSTNQKSVNLGLSESINYLEFNFKRNLTLKNSFTPEEFFKTYFYNQLYFNITVGSNKLEIPFYFYLQQYPLVLESSNVPASEVKGIYDEKKSNSYIPLGEKQYFMHGDLTEGILSKDYFYFNNNESYIQFYLSKNNSGGTHITEGGKIGLRLYPLYKESKSACFITNLKENNLISSYVFSFKYDSSKIDEDSGKFYIGTYPHLLNKNKYDKENYINFQGERGYDDIDWIYFFSEVRIDNITLDRAKQGFFYSELGFIIGTENFFSYLDKSTIWKEYLYNNKKCHKQNFRIDDFEGRDINYRFLFEFTGYYCDKDVDIEKLNLGNISFVKRDINYLYIFNITNNDLWIEKNGYKYFMIIQTADPENNWYLGKPFFKKYQMVFEYDKKMIGLYTKISEDNSEENEDNEEKKNDNKDNNNNNNPNDNKIPVWILIVSISGLLLIIIGLAVLLIRCYFMSPRKKRANELLDDNYDYPGNNINE